MKSLHPAGRLYAMQTGMKLDSKTPECRKFLVKLMDQLESVSGSRAQAVFLFTSIFSLSLKTFRWFALTGQRLVFVSFTFVPRGQF